MPRYIDANKIDFRLPTYTDEDGEVLIPLLAVKKCIEQTPEENVRENTPAKWIINSDGYVPYCSACGYELPIDFDTLTNFCPNCGAIMAGIERRTMTKEEFDKMDKDDMIPVDEWDGSCYQAFFEQFCEPNANENVSAWDILAGFIKCVYVDKKDD